jgi:putative endonuclease
MWYAYALKSLKDGNLYIGMSENPEKRLNEHNTGMTKSTKHRRPFEIIYKENHQNRFKAREHEKYLKSGFGREFLKQYIKPL